MNIGEKNFFNIENYSSNIIIFLVFLIIFSISYGVTLYNIFLFHDDWVTFYWNRTGLLESITTHHYFSAHNQMARTVGHIFMSLNQYYLNDISSGNFFRFLSIIILSLIAVIFSKWMFNNGYNKIFSIFFSSSALILPTFHVPIFTNTFQFVIIGILACVILLHMYDNYFKNKNLLQKKYGIIFYSVIFFIFIVLYKISKNLAFILFLGFLLAFLIHYVVTKYKNNDFSILKSCNFGVLILTNLLILNCYLASGMFIFAAIVIKVLSPLSRNNNLEKIKALKIFLISILSIAVFYIGYKIQFNLDNLTHFNKGRSFIIDTNLDSILNKIQIYFVEILPIGISLWFPEIINTINGYFSYILALFIVIVLFAKIKIKYVVIVLLSVPATVAPVLLPSDGLFFPYRALIGHGVLVYFLILWSMNEFINFELPQKYLITNKFIGRVRKQKHIFTTISLVIIMLSCNYNINKYFVIPQTHEQNYLRSKLDSDLLRSKISGSEEINIVLKSYTKGNYLKNNKAKQYSVESAGTFQGYDWAPLILTGILRELGYKNQVFHSNSEFLKYEKPQKIHKLLPWGNLIFGSNVSKDSFEDKFKDVIYINMNELNKIY